MMLPLMATLHHGGTLNLGVVRVRLFISVNISEIEENL